MGRIQVRYLVARQRKRRPARYYWVPTPKLQQAGFAVRRLPDIPVEATRVAEQLNAELDAWYRGERLGGSGPAPGTLAALDDLFQREDEFKRLASRSQRDYLTNIKSALAFAGDQPVAALTVPLIKSWYREQKTARGIANARNAAAAFRRLLTFGRDEGWIPDNPALRLRVEAPRSRSRVWTLAERDRFCAAALAAGHPSMALAVMLGWCIGQRPSDLRTLPWSAYDGALITLRQAKTGHEVAIPVLPELRRALDAAPRIGIQMVVSETTRRPYAESQFQHTFAEIRAAAGLPDDLQFRDLRRTLATALGAAGCTDDQIRAITGHRTRAVVAVYVRPDRTFAEGAIRRLRRASRNAS